jgi:nucleotide-binding universal stress UspA family protein
MKPTRPIVLLANAGDAPEPAAAETACDLARRIGARLFVVHVAGDVLPSKLPAYTVLAALVARCEAAGGLVTRASLRPGAADDEEILAEAAEIGAGLIVVSGRDCRLTRRSQDGELGECLARRAPCPVLIVRANEPGTSRARLTIGGTGAVLPRHAGLQRAVAG